MVDNDEPIDYFDIDAGAVREDHSINQLDTPREIYQKLDRGVVANPGEYLMYQRRKRLQIMQGLHQSVEKIDELEDLYEAGGFE